MVKMTVYDVITDCIIKRLGVRIVPFNKPWKTFGQPKNPIRDKEYRVINHFLLGCANFTSPYFHTFKLLKQHSGLVHKGERPFPCIRMDLKLVVIATAQAPKVTDFILGKGGRNHE